MKQWIVILAALMLLAACGVKGRLYHPEDPPTRKPLFAAETPDADAKKGQDDQQVAPDTNAPGKDKDLDIENTGIGHSGVDIEPGNK